MKNIIITGASSGIGKATARLLAARGYHIILVARNEVVLGQLQAELGNVTRVFVCDVRNYSQVTDLVTFALTNGPIDVLVNNAGVGFFDPVANGSIDQWHEMVDTNVKGLLNCIHAALPHLIESKGHIVNIGSVGAHNVFQNSGIYCATKHAVLAISESLRLELPDKISVTTISPGSVNTPFIENTTSAEMLDHYRDYFAGGLSAEIVAEQVLHAIQCPPGSVISEIVIRPSRSSR